MDIMKSEDVQKLAALCRIDLTDKEAEKLRGDMESILGYISEIKEVVALNGSAVGQVDAPRNIMREDGEPHASCVYTNDILAAAPDREGDFVKVKAIL